MKSKKNKTSLSLIINHQKNSNDESMMQHLLLLLLLLHAHTTLSVTVHHLLDRNFPSLQTERVAIQWIDTTEESDKKMSSSTLTQSKKNKKKSLRPSLVSYTVAVLRLPPMPVAPVSVPVVPTRVICGPRIFDFNANGTSAVVSIEDAEDDDTHETIQQLARLRHQAARGTTKSVTATMLLNMTNLDGTTTSFVPSSILESCHVYDPAAGSRGSGGATNHVQRTSSWIAEEEGEEEEKILQQQLLHQLLTRDMFASVAIGTEFMEMEMAKAMPEPPDPMAEVNGIVTSIGDIVKGPIEGVLKPVVKLMGEVVSDTVGGVIESTLTPESAGDMNDQLLRSLVPGLTMSLVENLTPTLAQSFPDTMSEALSESMRERLTMSLSKSLEPKLVSSLTKSLLGSVTLWTTSMVSHTIDSGLSHVLSSMLTKSLAHSITPSLIHTLSHDATQDYYAYMCFHHKTYCQYTSYAPSQVFYASYYASYYSAAASP